MSFFDFSSIRTSKTEFRLGFLWEEGPDGKEVPSLDVERPLSLCGVRWKLEVRKVGADYAVFVVIPENVVRCFAPDWRCWLNIERFVPTGEDESKRIKLGQDQYHLCESRLQQDIVFIETGLSSANFIIDCVCQVWSDDIFLAPFELPEELKPDCRLLLLTDPDKDDSETAPRTTLHARKEILAQNSEYFAALFFGGFLEEGKEEFRLDNLGAAEMIEVLHSLYPLRKEFNPRYDVETIIQFSDYFGSDLLREQAKAVLELDFDSIVMVNSGQEALMRFFKMAEKNGFDTILEKTFEMLDNTSLKSLFQPETFQALKEKTREMLLRLVAEGPFVVLRGPQIDMQPTTEEEKTPPSPVPALTPPRGRGGRKRKA